MKNYRDIIWINLLSLTIGIALYYSLGEKVEVLGAVIATGISLSLGIKQYKAENDRIFKELFLEFNERYDKKFNNRLKAIEYNLGIDENFKLNQDEENSVIDYLNLCAEEYLWFQKDRIPIEVWNSWENGMVYYMNLKPITEIVRKEMSKPDSYYGLFEKIGKRLNQ